MNPRTHHNDERLKRVYEEYWDRLCEFAGRLVGDKDEAEDMVQKAFICMYQNDNYDNPKAYLYIKVKNLCLTALRRRKHFLDIDSGIDAPDPPNQELIESEMIRADVVNKIFQEIEKLPKREREIIKLSILGRNVNHIAKVMNCDPNHIRVFRQRGFKAIRELLGVKDFSRYVKKKKDHIPRTDIPIVELDSKGKIINRFNNRIEIHNGNNKMEVALSELFLGKRKSNHIYGRYFMYESDYNKLNNINKST